MNCLLVQELMLLLQHTIANDVKFATHDASANFYIEGASDIYGRISIGNHVFIGMGTIILPGVTIGDHCIIAAGSVVTKSFFENGGVLEGIQHI